MSDDIIIGPLTTSVHMTAPTYTASFTPTAFITFRRWKGPWRLDGGQWWRPSSGGVYLGPQVKP